MFNKQLREELDKIKEQLNFNIYHDSPFYGRLLIGNRTLKILIGNRTLKTLSSTPLNPASTTKRRCRKCFSHTWASSKPKLPKRLLPAGKEEKVLEETHEEVDWIQLLRGRNGDARKEV